MTDLAGHLNLFLAPFKKKRWLVACSGGPDSMALLDAADRWRQETGGSVAVGHVDHGLRGRHSRADAVFVEKECAQRGLPFGCERVPVTTWARYRRRGTEDAARELRYGALARLARRFRCGVVATAHTLDDQAETVFLNLLRGTGPAGLAGMAAVAPWPVPSRGKTPQLWRPFLAVEKKQILKELHTRQIRFRTDASNSEPVFLRNQLRPILQSWESLRPGFFKRVAQTATILRDEEEYWRIRFSLRRKRASSRLERAVFLRYHIAEQRRCLRQLHGLTRFDVLERVRRFAADNACGPLDVPGGQVSKTERYLIFHRRQR